MELESLRSFLLQKPGVVEERPFGPQALVFKVMGKMFALVAWQEDPIDISLKCDPFYAEELREQYAAIRPGYHLNKLHWNTIALDGSISEEIISGMINESYVLVVKKLTKKERAKLENL